MMRLLLFGFLVISITANADVKTEAITGQATDAVTTVIGITQGATELNPLGPVISIAVKPIAFAVVDQLDEEDKVIGHSALSAAGWGASGNNLCVLVGGGIGCIFVGIAAGVAAWNRTVQERQFWEWCTYFRKETPDLECVWTD